MTKRERLQMTLEHKEPDKVAVDMGGTIYSGISASTLMRLRKALGLTEHPVKILEPFQLIGGVEEDVREALDVDVISIFPQSNMFGFKNENWKPWKLQDGTDVLVPEDFVTTVNEYGDTLLYPRGDRTAPPGAKLPKGGFYFDLIVRQEEVDLDGEDLNAREDYAQDYSIMSEDSLKYIEKWTDYIYENTEYGIVGGSDAYLGAIGGMVNLAGPGLIEKKGIRNFSDLLIAHYTMPEYIKEHYAMCTEIALKNLELYYQAVGNKIQVCTVSGVDYGTQNGEMISPDIFREFYKPHYKKINDWIHRHTHWKTFYHCCGSVVNLLDDFADMGMDIFNPVQCSAAGMDPVMLKQKYGDKLVFWGGGVDTQKTLPFGTPEEVRKEVTERLEIFAKGGGFVFNTVHNIQHGTPVENILAMFDAIKEFKNRKR